MQIFTQPVAPKTTTTITESVETPEPTIDSIKVSSTKVTNLPLSANVLTDFSETELKTILHTINNRLTDINNRLTNIEALLQNHWAETTINVENINALDQTITNTLEIRSQE